MINGGAFFTATLLLNGRLLVVGDYGAEVYDPTARNWTATGSMAAHREDHTSALMPSGKVLVAGGRSASNGAYLQSAEIYDPSANTWTATAAMSTPRAYHSMTRLPNGLVLVAGGKTTDYSSSCTTSAALYNPSTGTWASTGPLGTARYGHTATLLPNGKVLAVCGSGTSKTLGSAELYDPGSGTWTSAGSLPFPLAGHTATLLPNSKVLLAGGASAPSELYDPSAGTWTRISSMITARFGHTATALPNGKVLVVGGSAYSAPYELSSAEVYDANTGWTAAGSMSVDRTGHAAALLPNGKVLAAGGGSIYQKDMTSTELYESTDGITWPVTTLTITPSTNGSFQFTCTNNPGALLGVVITTNPAQPVSEWTFLRAATEMLPGHFQFVDGLTNSARRFYAVRSPF
jgi:hypothetical protein